MRFYLSPTSPSKAAASHVERCGFAFLMQQQVKSKLLKNSMLGREKETKICCRDIWLRYLHQVPAVVPKVFVEGLRQYFCSFSPPPPPRTALHFCFLFVWVFLFLFFLLSASPDCAFANLSSPCITPQWSCVCVCVVVRARLCVCGGHFREFSQPQRALQAEVEVAPANLRGILPANSRATLGRREK